MGGEGGGGGAVPVPSTPAPKKPEEPKEPEPKKGIVRNNSMLMLFRPTHVVFTIEPGKSEETGGQAPLPTGEMAPDLTKVPQQLEAKFEELDPESSLRPTIITAGPEWTRKHKKVRSGSIELPRGLTTRYLGSACAH